MFATHKTTHIVISFIVILTMMVNTFSASPAQAQGKDGIRRETNADSGRLSFIGPESGRSVAASKALGLAPDAARPADPALALAQRFAPEFGLANPGRDLAELRTRRLEDGRVAARYRQTYQGIPVLAGELIVNTNENGDLYSMSGEVATDLSLSTEPAVGSDQARQTALRAVQKWYFETPADFVSTEPELWVYDESLIFPSRRPPELIWRMEVTASDKIPVNELILLNAQTGQISLHFNQIDTGWHISTKSIDHQQTAKLNQMMGVDADTASLLFSPVVNTYTANNGTSLPGTFVCNQTDPTCSAGDADAQSAHAFALGTFDLYDTKHNRNSIDGAGMTIVSTVHFDSGYDNAFWDGSQMIYGDGYGFANADDIVAHELTHGVTDYESKLLYIYQSGAINESLSDLWGEYYDQSNSQGNDDSGVKWLLGEDVTDLGAFRSMSNPPAFGDPDKITSALYYKGQDDNGGVHRNSGVNNKAVFLMVDGGTFNGKTVVGIGWDKTAAIYYEAQTNLLGSGSNYSDLYYALQQACSTLTGGALGITLENCINVKLALDAVQMNTPLTAKHLIIAPLCPAGMVPSSTLFEDKLEGLLTTNWVPSSLWSLNTEIASSPTHSMYGNSLARLDDSFGPFLDETVAMNTSVTIQPNTYLHFHHAYDLEGYTTAFYDGGVVEYSTNGGATWLDAGTLFSAGANYTGKLSAFNPNLGGRKAFSGSSFSIYSQFYNLINPNLDPSFPPSLVSSRFNLSSLAGQNVRIRFRFATDDLFYFKGWYIDDVKIYTCLGTPLVPVLQAPANNALVTDYTPTLNWADSTPAIDRYHLQVSTDATFASTLYDEDNLAVSEFTIPSNLDENTKYYWRVRAFNSEDATNNWSAVWSFRAILMAPVLVSPADLSSPLTLRPTFTWTNPNNNGPAPTNYTIQIASNAGFTTIVHTGTALTTSYTPAVNLPANKQLFWRVKANGPNGPSAYSSPTISFFTPQTAPPAPTLTSPATGALTMDYSPELKWAAGTLPGGTTVDHFQIQIDNDFNFSSPVEDDNTVTTTNYIPSPDLASNTKFYWRVRTFNNNAEFSPWSAVRNFRTALLPPVLNTPVDDDTVDSLRPTFDWDDVSGATGYTIQISKNDTFTQIINTGNPATSQYTPTVDLAKDSTFYWRVLTKGLNGPSAWTELPPVDRSFITPAAVPGTPTLVAPATGALTTDYSPALSWTMPATSSAFDHFIVQVDNNTDFSSPEEEDLNVPSSPFSPSPDLASNTKFYWRVRAVNATGDMGNWSAVRNFRTALVPPVLNTPADNSAVNSLRPSFDWNDVAGLGVTGYTIQISKNEAFTMIVASGAPVTSTFTPTVDLPKNSTLYWRVQTKGLNGPSLWTPSVAADRSFITPASVPAAPTLVAPATGALVTDYSPALSWTIPVATPAVDHFIVQVDNNADFSSPEEEDLNVPVSPFSPSPDLASNAKYYWRVRAVNTSGDMGNWSAVRNFRTALLPPALFTPADGSSLSSPWPVFNWSDVTGAKGYTIQVSRNNTFTLLVVNANTIKSVYATIKALPAGSVLYWRVRTTGTNGPSGWSATFTFTTP